ncbi:Hsp33 family molecular chaperone HslO [Ralstonia insidiosa]|uniref:Hsp33 chaperonin n=1 Tax=Ralstonia insidiosa TaxID=190721 RepID=A0A191ZXL4_9RALS|nr:MULTISPECIES: Hsp33 family molecular chaperone HslO [Ralstonia]ANH71468.1 hsp33 family protein [Ralstonia insidiosa]ANJ72801.1 Hsp33 chaperonin [Ralstonia insidiosa]EPX98506.1 Hsp33 chaperonin [Ralstonia sp. AU12-08]KAB0473360.1 Hsp33 family molecular chaperone HslO [Ralstonia insidiosa]MBY4704645.1 Hsp33 family molecular chaperone HslO [Ralstonia insidiosa]
MTDELKKFVFDAAPVRGELVRLESTWQEILRRRRYPAPVSTLLGEMMAAAALLSANLKFNGALVMQLHGDGPVRMLVVECNSDLSMRATAKIAEGAEIADDATLASMVNVHGRGRFAITLDPHDKLPGQQPYQGIVPLSDETGPLTSMTEVLEQYMQASEQLDTRLWLAADNKVASGMLLQRLPSYGGTMEGRPDREPAQVGETGQPLHKDVQEQDLDTWERVCQLGKTLRREELLEESIDTLIKRLYWEEMEAAGIRMFEPLAPHFRCSCSRLRVGAMLRTLGQPEIEGILEEQGKVEIDCEFCGQHYSFDAVDCAQLFAQETVVQAVQGASGQRH